MENKDQLPQGVAPLAATNNSSDSKGKSNWFILSLILLAAIIGFGFICLFTGKSLEGVSLIVGCLITKLGTLIDFMYGSSQGSKDKDGLPRPLPGKGDITQATESEFQH